MENYIDRIAEREGTKKGANQVAVVCYDCGKILRWLDINEEAAEKKINDVKIWHNKICWKKNPKNKGRNRVGW